MSHPQLSGSSIDESPVILSKQQVANTDNLIAWFLWTKEKFTYYTQNSPISRITHECWLRNIAVALGNSPKSQLILETLKLRLDPPSLLVREHVEWALKKQFKNLER